MKFAELTTFRVGGAIRDFIEATSEEMIVDGVKADPRAQVIGGGSNILASDRDFDGTVIRISTQGSQLDYDPCAGGLITVAAGVDWDAFVAQTVVAGFSGLENLSGIPGRVGAAPIQNIGAYGQEFKNVVARVRTFDRFTKDQRTFTANQCGFGYRTSRFKEEPNRYVILDVTVQLQRGELSIPITYPELAKELGVNEGDRASTKSARAKVLEIRSSKGMVLSQSDKDTWSAGSFFINPSVAPALANKLPASAPRWPNPDGSIKLSAAWLLEHSGISKGFKVGGAAISTKHVLAITNSSDATSEDLLKLADECQRAVKGKFSIDLVPEVQLINC
jgi:UDP-N-acetylmuramate dehydrogenase